MDGKNTILKQQEQKTVQENLELLKRIRDLKRRAMKTTKLKGEREI